MNPTNQNLTGIVANPYNTQGSNTLNLGNQTGNLPSVPNTLNAGNVGNFKSLNTPTGTQTGNFLNELTANYQTNLNSLQSQQQNAQTSVQDLMNQLTGQTGDKITAENQVGLPSLNAQARDLQTLSQRQLAAYAQNIFNNDVNATGTTRTAQNGNEAMITRQHGIDAMITNANISAISGQIQTAQAQVDRAMSLKYDPIKQQIENQKFILEQVNTKEARAATMVKDFQLKQIDKQQADESELHKLSTTAAGFGAPTRVLGAVKDLATSGDPMAYYKSVSLLGPYLTDPAERTLKYAQAQKALNEAKAANIGDPMETLSFAQLYQSTGKIPTGIPKGTFGKIAQLAKDLPLTKGQIIQRNTGVTPGSDTTFADALSSLNSAIELSKQLKQLDQQRVGGLVSGTIGKVFGSSDQQRYVDLRGQIVDLLSRARSGAAINETELRQYNAMLPGRFSEAFGLGAQSDVRIDNFTNVLSSDLKNKSDSKGWAIVGLSTVNIGNQEYKVGDIIDNGNGQQGRVNADGTISLIQ